MRVVAAILLVAAAPALGGVFILSDNDTFDPFVIVHPIGYDGTGGVVEVSVCIEEGSEILRDPLEDAASIWNQLLPMPENCEGCALIEEGVPPDAGDILLLRSTLLHELGHCAMGLGHTNWQPSSGSTSFTESLDASAIDAGADGVRGTNDDIVSPLPGTRLLHWFRISDNDPFSIDETVIDIDTYSRRIVDLPGGHFWPANGNRAVGDFLGLQDSQNVMYSAGLVGQRYLGLSADDVNTVKFGMTGIDTMEGTADDYTVSIITVPDCASADIVIAYEPLGKDQELGFCSPVFLEPIPTGGTQVHYSLVSIFPDEPLRLVINSDNRWDSIFFDGFESGDLSRWTTAEE